MRGNFLEEVPPHPFKNFSNYLYICFIQCKQKWKVEITGNTF